ncbi:hypothetical protein Acr_25g0001770 [Actinidia rufa]|uniref:Uncharacterized protein n=1 Tax=Actinidia rufa TaxID=165716 RepID=A0A7J0GYG1_9ERIC|nr:hypothetical protein Acr_25g0001770 [Actinidia rufa]
MKGVASTLHQVIKFAAPKGEKTLYGDQIAAKQCYLAIVKTKAATKTVHLMKEERKVLEDVKSVPEEKVVEDLIYSNLDVKLERMGEN